LKGILIMKKLLCILLALMVCLCAMSFAGCGEETTNAPAETTTPTTSNTATGETDELGIDLAALGITPEITKSDKDYGFQLEKPEKGETVAIMHTSMGDISIRLFPDECPNTVKNFIELAKAGKYDGVIFHRVIADFMIQGGDFTNQDGTGGETYNGEVLKDEFCDKLVNLTGSLAMANSGRDTNGSQFFINDASPESFDFSGPQQQWESYKTQLKEMAVNTESLTNVMNYYSFYNTDIVPDEIVKLYEEHGGNYHLDGAYSYNDKGHTVFGQVYDGMDVVNKISAVETGENDKPVKDVTIENIEITEYK